MAINLARGRRNIDCGCFQSALKQRLSWVLVARNVVLAALLLVPALQPVDSLAEPAVAESLLLGTVLFVLLQTLNILWSVVPAWRQRRAVPIGADK